MFMNFFDFGRRHNKRNVQAPHVDTHKFSSGIAIQHSLGNQLFAKIKELVDDRNRELEEDHCIQRLVVGENRDISGRYAVVVWFEEGGATRPLCQFSIQMAEISDVLSYSTDHAPDKSWPITQWDDFLTEATTQIKMAK